MTGPDRGGWTSWTCTRWLIVFAGGRAKRITPGRPATTAELHGLILGGGADIHPSHYKEEILLALRRESRRVGKLNFRFFVSIFLWLVREIFSVEMEEAEPNEARDRLELSLLAEAVDRKLPVLGICRGEQLINIYFGGTLHQDISDFYGEEPHLETHRARKWVRVVPGTLLAEILNSQRARVNSLHHQSVKRLGENLRISAMESNGIVQAVEHVGLPFMMGLQWHPEFLPYLPRQRGVFRHLVSAAKEFGRTNNLNLRNTPGGESLVRPQHEDRTDH